jgi:thioesterase domain-containing protein
MTTTLLKSGVNIHETGDAADLCRMSRRSRPSKEIWCQTQRETVMIIPAADNMGLREGDAGVHIPLACNANDKGSLFAGSIFSGATLAAYRAAERLFKSRGLSGDLVAKTATINYLKRIATDGLAQATPISEPVLKPNGNYTVTMRVTISDIQGTAGAELSAEFILLQ